MSPSDSSLPLTEHKLTGLLHEGPFSYSLFRGRDFVIEFANDEALKRWGKDKSVIGKKLTDVIPEIIGQPYLNVIRNVYDTGMAYEEKESLTYLEKNGVLSPVYLNFMYKVLKNDSDAGHSVLYLGYDVTEQVMSRKIIAEAEARAQRAEKKFRNVVSQAHVGIAILRGPDFQFEMANKTYLALIEKTEEEILGKRLFDCLPETKPLTEPLLKGVMATATAYQSPELEVILERHGKKERTFFNLVYEPMEEADGSVSSIMVVANEVTEQRIQDENNSRLAAIVQSTSDAIIAVNLNRFIINWNASAERIFGYTESEILGKPITTLIPEDLWHQEDEIFDKILKDQPIEHLQTIRKHKSGSLIDISLSISPVKDKQGNIVSISKIARDISRQKTIEHLISDNEEKLKILVEASELGTWELHLRESRVSYSPRYLRYMGYRETDTPTHEELKKRLHPDDLKVREQAFAQAYDSGILNYTTRVIWPDGSLHWIEAKGKVLHDEQDNPLRIIGTIRDLTDEKRKRQQIEENELRLRTAALSSELGTWDYDPQTEVMRWDDASRKLFGVGPDVPVTVDLFWECMHPDDRSAALDRMLEALNPRVAGNYESEYRIIGLPNDEVRWLHAKGKAFFDENQVPYHFSGTVLDITEKRMALEELKDSEQKFRLLADSMPQLIWTGDVHGTLNYFNRSVYRYSGMTPEDIAEKGWIQIVHPDEREENIRLWMESVKSGQDFLFEHRFRRNDGEYRWQLSRAIPQRDASGHIQMWVGTSTDIHDQKTFSKELETKVQERTKDLQQANQELERMNEELASFAYVSSHDLQEPLRKIQTFANRIAEKEVLSDSGKDYFRRMQDAAQRMHLLIEDLLAYSRTSTTEKVFETCQLATLIEEVKHDLEQVIKEKQATIAYKDLPEMNIIPFQFRQLFTNILSNALKFSKQDVPSHILIRAEEVKGGSSGHPELVKDKAYYHLTVQDNGIGFSPEYNMRIFEVFQRLHGKHEYKGTGIGLAICKKIMENHQGSISAVGEPGVGATFHIYVPA